MLLLQPLLAAAVLLLLALCQSTPAAANTEIRNFFAPAPAPALAALPPRAPQMHALNATHSERAFAVRPAPLFTPLHAVCARSAAGAEAEAEADTPCAHELWLALALDGGGAPPWARARAFTLRVAWPAFYPTAVDIALYTPAALAAHFQGAHPAAAPPDPDSDPGAGGASPAATRTTYARIRLADTGVRNPSLPHAGAGAGAPPVPFTATLEPLHAGVLPATLLPALALLAPVLAGAALALPPLARAFAAVAREARRELYHAHSE
ncbi:hypothetical protein DFH11DRAFT_1880510 [Phellopilus nigrolimitatus]|nr:hypothetical protein DFH11DRAFT_1880510 [Phellopilus nigrolimitatus]